MSLVVLMTGDKRWDDATVVAREVEALPPHTVVITLSFPGVDAMAQEFAMKRNDLGVQQITKGAPKALASTRAGVGIRWLKQLRQEGHDVMVVVIHADLDRDRFGHTPQIVRLARIAGITVRLVEG